MTLSGHVAHGLVNILLQEGKNSHAQNPKAWTLVLEAVLRVRANLLIEGKIFEHLLTAFLKATIEIQNIVLSELNELTQNILNSNQVSN